MQEFVIYFWINCLYLDLRPNYYTFTDNFFFFFVFPVSHTIYHTFTNHHFLFIAIAAPFLILFLLISDLHHYVLRLHNLVMLWAYSSM
jgi:hypothetical protein